MEYEQLSTARRIIEAVRKPSAFYKRCVANTGEVGSTASRAVVTWEDSKEQDIDWSQERLLGAYIPSYLQNSRFTCAWTAETVVPIERGE